MQKSKYSLILALFISYCIPLFAQSDASYDWRDSSKISAKHQKQQTEFLNNNYPYPARPRDKWELGFSAGNSMILGDIKSKADVGGAITLRKAISPTFSIRPGYYGSYNQGYPNSYAATPQGGSKRSYQNWTHMFGLDLISTLNNASRYRGNPKTNIYLVTGYSLILAKTFYFAKPFGNGNHIDNAYKVYYGGYTVTPTSPQTGVITTVGGYKNTINGRRGWSLLNGVSAGGGIAFKLNKKVNLGLEQRFTLTPYDGLDAYIGGKSNDMYSYSSARLNMNIGSSARRVEPLWWLNPNNFIYNELNRPSHMKLPPQLLPDADGDGVTDQFDMEPNTPAGVPVDVRGRAKDTDGDGVPDYKDKELITSSLCFPVDADGVGTCPPPACCQALRDSLNIIGGDNTGGTSCNINLPSIQFAENDYSLPASERAKLDQAARDIKDNPECNILVSGHVPTPGSNYMANKLNQRLSFDRVNAVIRYLTKERGISENRFIFKYGDVTTGASVNTVELSGTKETGPNRVERPHQYLREMNRKKR